MIMIFSIYIKKKRKIRKLYRDIFMGNAKKENMLKTYHIRPDYNFFWGKNCKKKFLKMRNKAWR